MRGKKINCRHIPEHHQMIQFRYSNLIQHLLEAKASLWFTPVFSSVSQSVSQLVPLSRLSQRGAFASPPSWMGLLDADASLWSTSVS